ncbi:MAG: hypothetical protein AAF517_06140, partial [Planctomycetota bacterium]
ATGATLDREVFLFLRPLNTPKPTRLQLDFVGYGVRVSAKGRVYRFGPKLQFEPQLRFPPSLDAVESQNPVGLGQFESDLRHALRLTWKYMAISQRKPSPSRNRRLVDLLGPPRRARTPLELLAARHSHRGTRPHNLRVRARLTYLRDSPEFFEGLSRIDPGLWKWVDHPSHNNALRVAIDEAQSVPARVAALWFVAKRSEYDERTAFALLRLADHSHQLLRLHAISALGPILSHAGYPLPDVAVETLQKQWRESDSELVRTFLARALGISTTAKARVPDAFHLSEFHTILSGRFYRADLFQERGKSSVETTTEYAVVVRDDAGEEVRRVDLRSWSSLATVPEGEPDHEILNDRIRRFSRMSSGGYGRRAVLITPALPDGTYEFRVEWAGKDRTGKIISAASPPQRVTVKNTP